jgi:hypothetical protein
MILNSLKSANQDVFYSVRIFTKIHCGCGENVSRRMQQIPFFHEIFIQNPRWRIHSGAEVTAMSTNTQHTLSPPAPLDAPSHRPVSRHIIFENRKLLIHASGGVTAGQSQATGDPHLRFPVTLLGAGQRGCVEGRQDYYNYEAGLAPSLHH